MSLNVRAESAPSPPAPVAGLARVRPFAEGVFAAVALASCLGAFVGLSASSWWTDELFTLYVIDARGAAEVLGRALTDTQPPGYYLVLHGWSQLFGSGEAPLRGLSAILAAASVAVFWWTSRRMFSAGARSWAAAIAVTSPLWFVQSQNIRNYSLCLLLMAVMLGLALRLRRRTREGRAGPWASWASLTVAGAFDASVHFYGLLGFGALLAALIVSLPSWPMRAALALSGLLVTLGEVAYIHLLIGHTQENLQHLWFQRDPLRLLAVSYDVWKLGVGGAARVAVLLLVAAWAAYSLRRGRSSSPGSDGDGRWLAAVCAFVLAAVYLGGIAVSLLFAPSLSDRNVLTAAPVAWVLLAVLYDAAMRRTGPRAAALLAAAAAALLVFHAGAIGQGRLLQRNETWRETSHYVASLPGCRGGVLDVVQPDRFGPDTPFYRRIARRYFFGAYLGDRWTQVRPHPPADYTDPRRDPEFARRVALRVRDPAACPVLAWAVHDVDTAQALALRRSIAALAGVPTATVRLREFSHAHLKGDRWASQPSGYVFERTAGPGGSRR